MDSFESNEECLNYLTLKYDPWGECEKNVSENKSNLVCDMVFEDSFTSSLTNIERKDDAYIPLDDSQQYLEGLQKKLARIQGKTKSSRENEMKRMIKNIALSREDHTSNFLKSDSHEGYMNEELSDSDVKTSSLNTIDPQGPLGAMLRKLTPDHIALTEEELYELLKSDTLAKAYIHLQEEESDDSDTTSNTIEADNKNEVKREKS